MSGRPHDPRPLPPAPRAGGVLSSRPLPAPARLALDVGLGVAAALGQAPWGLWPVTLIALAALLWRIGGAPSARAAFLRALAGGAGHFALALFWITQPFLVEAEIYGWMAPFALVLMALGGGLFWAIPAAALHPLGHDRRSRALALALGLVLSDWLRGWIFTGFPWALGGHIWIDTPAGQIAAWGGALGLSALTLAAAALPAWGWTPARPGWRAWVRKVPGTRPTPHMVTLRQSICGSWRRPTCCTRRRDARAIRTAWSSSTRCVPRVWPPRSPARGRRSSCSPPATARRRCVRSRTGPPPTGRC